MQIYEKIATSANCVLECVAPDCRFWILGYFFYFCQIVFILNQMRRLIFFLGLLAAVMTACEENSIVDVSGTKGEVVISLSSSELGASRIRTRSEEVDVPEIDDFMVEIYSSAGIRLYRDTYANSSGKSILLNSGEYRLLAQHGDSAGVGFSSVWFAADCNFQVRPQTAETVEAVARMAKVKAAVKYGPQIALNYSDFYVELVGEGSKPLTFSKDETRAGYMPAGTITPLVYATVDGELKYFKASPCECAPGDFVTFNVDTKPLIGSLAVSVIIDNGVELIEKELTLSSGLLPKDAPSITVSGFDGGCTLTFTEAVASPLLASGMKADIVAAGKIASCVLGFAPESAAMLDVEETVDLCTVDEVTAGKLKAAGFDWLTVTGGRLAYVDFTGLASRIIGSHCDPDALKSLTFNVKVVDSLGQENISETYTVSEKAPAFSFDVYDWNYYARRIDHLTASVSSGNPDALEVQYYNGSEWIPASLAERSGNDLNFNAVRGLQPVTEYPIRAIYNGNDRFVKEYRYTTEAAAQVGNAGFEEWTTETFNYKVTSQGNRNIDWYLPWNDSQNQDHWWAINSKKTMRSECSGTAFGIGNNFNFKVFPTISYFDGNSRSAQLATITTGKSATNTGPGSIQVVTAAGEMWIGTANDSGDHLIDGHAFPSRPSKMSFSYQYSSVENEKFYVYIELKDKDGNIIFVNEIKDGNETTEWNIMTIPFIYNDITKKITSIYVCFKSSSKSSPGHEVNRTITMPNGNVKAIVGSILRIDDIELIYE